MSRLERDDCPRRLRRRAARALTASALALAAMACTAPVGTARAAEAGWSPEPLYPPGVEGVPGQPAVGLGRIGDVEFWAPNRGVLITTGNGSAVSPGLWAYDGVRWHQFATVCGASDGRIAWAGPDELWTVSDGRPGQAANPANGEPAPLANRTLCHIAKDPAEVVGSYASPAFEASSYQEMHAAGCLSASDCWFAGDPLPEGQIGAFHLHWDGHSLSEQPNPQGHAVGDMARFGRYLYESVRLAQGDQLSEPEPFPPLVLRRIAPVGYQPTFTPLFMRLPDYSQGELPEALDFLRLSAAGESLWAAAGPSLTPPEQSAPGEVTVMRYEKNAWTQLLGPSTDPPGGNPLAGYVVESIAAEPGGTGAWLALDTLSDASSPSPLASATVARVTADGTVSDLQTLPTPAMGLGAKGAAAKIVCPAHGDCWLATTQGWLFHYSEGSPVAPDTESPFTKVIGFRPLDEGLPQVQPDAPPADTSGVDEEPARPFVPVLEAVETKAPEARVTLPLLSHIKTKLVRRYTLEVRFHLAVKARVRVIAKRRRSVVASTRMDTLAAGNRQLLLTLDPHRWPTKLDMQTHALRPLPTVAAGEAGTEGEGAGSGVVVSALRSPAALEHRELTRPW